jgi:hypothetical protein
MRRAASIDARRTGTHRREFAVGEDDGMHAPNHYYYYYATELLLLWRLIIHIECAVLSSISINMHAETALPDWSANTQLFACSESR